MKRPKILSPLIIEDCNGQPCTEGDRICIEMPHMEFDDGQIYIARKLIGKLKFSLSTGIGIVLEDVEYLELSPPLFTSPIGKFRNFKHTKYKWYKL